MQILLKKASISLVACILLLLTAASNLQSWEDGKKFALEIFGGLTLINPSDLNMRPELDSQYEQLFRDNRYAQYAATGYYDQVTKLGGGEFKSLKKAVPLGLRLKYYLSERAAISIGFSYIRGRQTSQFTNHFLLGRGGQANQEKYIYSPYTLMAEGYIPALGFHFRPNLFRFIDIETGISVGPLFSNCGFSFDYHREWMTAEGELLHEYKFYSLQENGKGLGISMEANVQLHFKLSKLIQPFIQISYAYRHAEDFSGRGYERDEGDIKWWANDWGMKVYQEYRSYGAIDMLIPSNNWTDYRARARDFELDLSGFQAVIGFLYRF